MANQPPNPLSPTAALTSRLDNLTLRQLDLPPNLTSFPSFPLLPLELRRQIYASHLSDPRIISIRAIRVFNTFSPLAIFRGEPGWQITTVIPSGKPYPLIDVSREARRETIEVAKCLTPNFFWGLRIPVIRGNTWKDVLWLENAKANEIPRILEWVCAGASGFIHMLPGPGLERAVRERANGVVIAITFEALCVLMERSEMGVGGAVDTYALFDSFHRHDVRKVNVVIRGRPGWRSRTVRESRFVFDKPTLTLKAFKLEDEWEPKIDTGIRNCSLPGKDIPVGDYEWKDLEAWLEWFFDKVEIGRARRINLSNVGRGQGPQSLLDSSVTNMSSAELWKYFPNFRGWKTPDFKFVEAVGADGRPYDFA